MNKIKKLTGIMVDAIFPPACPVCGQVIDFSHGVRGEVCRKCTGKLTNIKEPRCFKCGKELSDEKDEYCHDCSKSMRSSHPHVFCQGTAVFSYTEGIQNSIYRFKYQNKREYATFYAKEMNKICGEQIGRWQADALIPVPLHQSKYRKRGYNQSALIAKELSPLLKIPMDDNLLIRARKTIPMKELDQNQRLKNLENAFICTRNSVRYKKVIIVDDIYTTGATIDACARELMKVGVEEVYFVCLCIGRGF